MGSPNFLKQNKPIVDAKYDELPIFQPQRRRLQESEEDVSSSEDIIEYIDWRTDRTFKNAPVVTSVRKQGKCGACWAITAAGVIEGATAIHNGQHIELSE